MGSPFLGIDTERADLIARSIIPSTLPCGVYFLVKDGEIVYVGQSVDIRSRVSHHKKAGVIDFDTYSWVECDSVDLNSLEAEYILKFTPKFNKDFPSSDRFISIGGLRLRGVGKAKFRSYIAKADHHRYGFLDRTYYDLKALALDQAFLSLLDSEGVSHWW